MGLRTGYNLEMAINALGQNKIRSFLTSLGVIFGVASVIAMTSIGRGAEEEIVQQMKLLGANNVIVKRLQEQKDEKIEDAKGKAALEEKKRFSPGLTAADAEVVGRLIPQVETAVAEALYETVFIRQGYKRSGKLAGVSLDYFRIHDFSFSEGVGFNERQAREGLPVCVIGQGVKKRFFANENPIGKSLKCGRHWLTVVGVLAEKNITERAIKQLGVRDYNMDVFTPLRAYLFRYENRNAITRADIMRAAMKNDNDSEAETTAAPTETNYHEIDQITIRMSDSRYSENAALVLAQMLRRRHNDVVDFEVIVPQQLLAQEKRTRQIFNIVLGAIASISLVVGGVGIMNIMLASVMERTKEIGVRRSLGATRLDILQQFVSEAAAISLMGGFVGIALGAILSSAVEKFTQIPTIITLNSILLSFVVAASIGLIFGVYPARRAARLDPIVALRYE